jgi:FSR family fosmidomycin resistance protein-like MFS transporter
MKSLLFKDLDSSIQCDVISSAAFLQDGTRPGLSPGVDRGPCGRGPFLEFCPLLGGPLTCQPPGRHIPHHAGTVLVTDDPHSTQNPPIRPVRSAAYLAGWVALAHGVNDAYAAFLAPLLPRIMDKLGLSIALAATLAMTLSLAASVLQPLMGYLSDRYGRRVFVVLGPLLSATFLPLIGVTSSFWILIVFLSLGGLGSAVFHPPGASMAARVSEGKGSGLRMSVFSLGGSLGWAIGPLVAVGLVSWIGLEKLWVAMFPGILVALLLYLVLPPGRTSRVAQLPPSPRKILRRLRGPLGLLFGISMVGAFTQRVFLTMGPIVAARAGASEAAGALALSLYLGTQAVGTLTGGYLADRMDRGRLLAGMTFFAFPAHFLAVSLTPGEAPAYIMACAAGFFGMAMMPAIVVKAQELLPDSAAVSSGIVMGLAWGVGSLGVLGTGALGDWIGPREAAMVSMPALLLGTALALHPRLREGDRI